MSAADPTTEREAYLAFIAERAALRARSLTQCAVDIVEPPWGDDDD